jgi:hypothetical protein
MTVKYKSVVVYCQTRFGVEARNIILGKSQRYIIYVSVEFYKMNKNGTSKIFKIFGTATNINF